jgi:hypothetical protein
VAADELDKKARRFRGEGTPEQGRGDPTLREQRGLASQTASDHGSMPNWKENGEHFRVTGQHPTMIIRRVPTGGMHALRLAPIIESPRRLIALDGSLLNFGTDPRTSDSVGPRPIPAWHPSKEPGRIVGTITILVRARQLIADEQHWCALVAARARSISEASSIAACRSFGFS